MQQDVVRIGDAEIQVSVGGQGEPLLFLHSAQGFWPDQPFVRMLCETRRLIAPSHPGFGRSTLPDWIDRVDDIAHIYLELLDHYGLQKLDVVGCSIGGWIAAELATKVPERFRRLVLVGPIGVKTGSPDQLDLPDLFALSREEVAQLMFHDPVASAPDYSAMPEEDLSIVVRNQETLTLLGWEPYMHNPKLRHRLHRVKVPTLLLRGESDGLVSADYLDRYAQLIPGARTDTIPAAGHAPQVEQPRAFVARVNNFLAA
ncbi:alpha/beta fold hydrolase [Roseomonas sp. BN140053]|uniref:alpha/beta fold hydrolase n=1 Tax=Roseomonas sp. BN140053 TaxID=3391898 RepID=UPI0039EB472C